ncbi:hypothetical protein F7725_003361 [Dissostichus mawsoni]|uniref:Coiled-coil domain-containing protein 137 n=1 Tax=Dissostichus mawsoni TaxID=36200 RepID=A0A7J5YAY5_DISMA|nr:hypothetical protein F7725_003361 [Dissostichus mawsoni]
MGKNKKTQLTSQESNDNKLKRDGKPKKIKRDHIEHIPFKLREIMKNKQIMKTGKLKVKKPKETYVRRMETETKHVLFLTKNQVDRKPELAANKQERPADGGKSEKKKEHDTVRLQRLQNRKLDKQVDRMEKEMFVDHVPFGEVSMCPPSFSAKPRKAPIKPQEAPKQLLLNSLLGHTAVTTGKPSMARQRIMEEERVRAVEAYRLLKKQRQQQFKDRDANLEKLRNPK